MNQTMTEAYEAANDRADRWKIRHDAQRLRAEAAEKALAELDGSPRD